MKLRRLIQRDTTGCGLACVAMIAGKKYAEVKRKAIELGLVDSNGPFRTSCGELRMLVKAIGGEALIGRKATYWASLPDLAIAGINYREKKNEWHWVVFVREGKDTYVLDPWHKIKTTKRRDFGRMRLRSCIPIHAQQGTPADPKTAARFSVG